MKVLQRLSTASKVGLSWTALVTLGIYSFYLSKESVTSRRRESMRVRERMRLSNTGDYQSSVRKFISNDGTTEAAITSGTRN